MQQKILILHSLPCGWCSTHCTVLENRVKKAYIEKLICIDLLSGMTKGWSKPGLISNVLKTLC